MAIPPLEVQAPPEQRRRDDRRSRRTPVISRYSFRDGRRRDTRRDRDGWGTYVDSHGATLFAFVTAIATLNILDAIFTVLFLTYGGQELNPIVRASLDHGMWLFIVLKSVGIGVCLLVLTVTKNFLASRIGLGLIFGGYLVLLGWHVYLFQRLPIAG